MHESLMRVTQDQFLSMRNDITSTPLQLLEKLEYLKTTFSCFNAPVSRHHYIHSRKDNHDHNRDHIPKPNRTDKIKIGSRELSRENFGRKDFLALMNKLTLKNQDTIVGTLKNVFRDECLSIYCEITWDMMQRSPEFHELYMHVILVIESITEHKEEWKKFWSGKGETFSSSRGWCPPTDVINDEDYDEFCAFVKWKKKTNASLKALGMLEKNGWVEPLLISILSDIRNETITCLKNTDWTGDKITDAYLEQILVILEFASNSMHDETLLWVKECLSNVDSIRPSTRFKLYDIQDKINT